MLADRKQIKQGKEIIDVFKSFGFGIDIVINLKQVDFLDVTFNLKQCFVPTL